MCEKRELENQICVNDFFSTNECLEMISDLYFDGYKLLEMLEAVKENLGGKHNGKIANR
ncbi:hypothetical protein [Marinisporobacter balticus]|uniref:Uncharacterized protein n=1 Tax=Marinisporobacter balticus TaxID=2018667 RepID=A0A4R2KBU4_9FIRM|nr:hypothetical protein [Marinisporobacter balticus]TCO69537.1 hypothetical protein EV214_13161 [Marinisporobacter balticus]